MRWLKRIDERLLRWTLDRPRMVVAVVAVLVLLSCVTLPWMGGEFLPPFNEGTATVNLRLEPGTSLTESQRIAGRVESMMLEVLKCFLSRGALAVRELDEHAEGVNNTEFEVRFAEHKVEKVGWYYSILRAIPIAIYGVSSIKGAAKRRGG